MSLSPDQVKPFLLHEDRLVRAAAAKYFRARSNTRSSGRPDPELTAIAIRSADDGLEDGLELVDALELGISPESLSDFTAACLRADRRETERGPAGHSTLEIARSALRAAPLELILNRRAELLDGGFFTPADIAHIDQRHSRRKALRDVPSAELWRELQESISRPRPPRMTPAITSRVTALMASVLGHDPHPARLADLVEALMDRPKNEDALLETLDRLPADAPEPHHHAVMDLIAHFGPERAVPVLLDRLETALMPGLGGLMRALKGCPAEAAIPAAVAAWPRLPELARCLLPTLFSAHGSESAEAAALSLLLTETDSLYGPPLAEALCTMLSRRGFSRARGQAKRELNMLEGLRDLMVGASVILGRSFPEADAWRRARERRRKKTEALRARLDALGHTDAEITITDDSPDVETLVAGFENPAFRIGPYTFSYSFKTPDGDPCDGPEMDVEALKRAFESPAFTARSPSTGVLEPPARRRSLRDPLGHAPVRHHGRKVGRNAPCPCDSGRKFKKCCGSGRRRRPS